VTSTPGSNAIEVYLSGQDAQTGIGSYDLYVSKDGGAFQLAQQGISDTLATYRGTLGSDYGFYARATDNAGNQEPQKSGEEASTFLGDGLAVYPGDTDNSGDVDASDVLPIGTFYGRTGPPRTLSQGFTSVTIVPWTKKKATYADANGDGTINQNDLLPIGTFYGQTKPSSKAQSTEPATAEAGPSIQVRPLPVGTTVPVHIRVADGAVGRAALGWAASLKTPSTLTVKSATPTSVLGDNPIALKRHDEEAGTLAMGYTRRAPNGTVPIAGEKVMKVMLKVKAPMKSHARIRLSGATVSGRSGTKTADSGDGRAPLQLESPYAENVPGTFTLKPNYPNPASHATTIRFAVPEKTTVSLTVYDLLGRRVATLKQKEDVTAGWHAVQVDASRFASGTYFYRLRTKNVQKTKKMVVVR
jgi:hypothetical protein